MLVGYGSDWMGQSTHKYQIIGETMGEDSKIKEGIFNLVTEPPCPECELWDGHHCCLKDIYQAITKCELLDQIIIYLHSQGKYVLKQMPIEMISVNCNKYLAEPLTGLILRNKSEITDIKELNE